MEKRGLYVFAMSVLAGMLAAATLLLGEGRLLGGGDPRPLFLGYSLAGFFASVLWVLPSSMLADVADDDELNTGYRREGLFFGMLSFGEKIAAGMAILLSGALIEYFVRLEPSSAVQSADATRKIGLVYGLLPASLTLIGTLMVLRYRLNRQQVLVIQNRLQNQREEAGGLKGEVALETRLG
jgi:Na+/melibiose symporter-like transporter